jgi:predicted phosphoadenosine phosphosulfate sulfurtransferase
VGGKTETPKKYRTKNVHEASKDRIKYTFDNFEKIYVSFSGGKDSTVMLHLTMDEAIKRNRKVGIMFIDLEGQYDYTINHIKQCLEMYKDHIDPYWICLPIHLRNAVSMYETHWLCWDKESKDAWIKNPPKIAITDEKFFPFFHKGMEFEEFDVLFGKWYSQGQSCACLVGIRADESLNRFRTIASKTKKTHGDHKWTTKISETLYNVYPVYDWKTKDVWIYQYKNPDKPYNKLYDIMYQAGLNLKQMRICQPYGDDQRRGLYLFHIIEPKTWARIVARVNGANQGAMYMGLSGNISGYRRISKPPQHTWKSFAILLLNSLPPKTKEHFENKIFLWVKWWSKRGYEKEIPDEAPYVLETAKKVPSWRRICKALLRNDYWCKGIGFSQHKSVAYQKYLQLMRKRRKYNVATLKELKDKKQQQFAVT